MQDKPHHSFNTLSVFYTLIAGMVRKLTASSLPLMGWLCLNTPVLAQISGVVYGDHDRNGLQSLSEPIESGVAQVRVYAYVEGNPQPFTFVTGSNGRFTFPASQIAPGQRVRLELSGYPLYTFELPGTGASARFVQAPASAIGLGLSDPADYAPADPTLVVPLYQTGALQVNTNGLVAFPATVLTTPPTGSVTPTAFAPNANVGTVWATAYQRQSRKLFAISLLKRHAALGPLGLGGIYVTGSNGTSPYLDVTNFLTLASKADSLKLAARTLPASFSTTSTDGDVFALIGKVGLGGATFTPAEDRLWAINLYRKTLVSIRVGAPAQAGNTVGADAFTTYAIPQLGADKGVNRPWAVTYHRGKLYVGVVNDASISRQRTDLKAHVYRFDLTTLQFDPSPVLTVPLDYPKGWTVRGADDASSLGNRWEPWSDNWADYPTNVLNGTLTPALHRVVRPQPILSSIGFDAEGAMLLGFMDRTGHQTSRNQPAPTDTSAVPTVVYSGYGGGDVLRAALVNDTYRLELNGSAGSHSGSGVANGQGPSDGLSAGEFYAWEQYTPPLSTSATITNQETFAGSLLVNLSIGSLIAAVYNPLTTWSGGASLFDLYNGDLIRRYEIYRDELSTVATTPRNTFGSANGIGMITALNDAPPAEIGHRLWIDANSDGVQDPGEEPLEGVYLSLYTANGQWLASTRTTEQGRYSFRTSTSLPLAYHTTYLVAIGSDPTHQQYDRNLNILRVGRKAYKLTGWNQGVGANPGANDSDAFLLNGTATPLDGLPVMQFRLTVPGEVISHLDAGFQETCDPTATCLQVTWRKTK